MYKSYAPASFASFSSNVRSAANFSLTLLPGLCVKL